MTSDHVRAVRDPAGDRYLLLERSGEDCRVRDPATGEERTLPRGELEVVEGESPLEAAASGVAEPVRRVVTAAPNGEALGLLVELYHDGPLSARHVLDAYDGCESDLLGVVSEFRAAGVVEPVEAPAGRGYALTDEGEAGVAALLG